MLAELRPEDENQTFSYQSGDSAGILQVNGETVEIPAAGNLKIPLDLKKGNSLVRLACKEHATIDKLSSGDTRTMLLGIKRFSVRAAD